MENNKSLKDLLSVKKEVDKEDSGVKALLGEEEKALDDFIDKTKEKLDTGGWLKKGRKHELAGDYKKALEAYLHFMEGRLDEIGKAPHAGLQDYLGMVKHYLKIAECYEKVTHTSAGGKKMDMENAGNYYVKAAKMYIELGKFNEGQGMFEEAARCYAMVDSFDKAANAYIDAALLNYGQKKVLMACTCFIKGAEFYEKCGEYEKSSRAYLKAGEMNLEIKDVYGAINCYKKAAECYNNLGNPKEAIQYYIKSAELSSKVERYTDVADRYEGIAKSYERLEDYKNAIFYHIQAAELDLGNDDLAASYCYDKAAGCYAKLNDYKSAISYYGKSTNLRVNIKKHAEAAASSYQIGDLYEKLNDWEKAAAAYYQSGEFATSANSPAAADAYRKAAKMFKELAEKYQKENNWEKAVENFLEATKGLDRLEEHGEAAELYSKMAGIEFEKNYDTAIKYYLEAAERYMKVYDYGRAATCFIFAKDYLNAAANYTSYADNQLKMKQFFNAATGYRRAADAYRRLKKIQNMREAYSKAIHDYSQYLQNAEYIKTTDPNMNVGAANKTIAECYMESEDMPHARKHLEAAIAYFKEKNIQKEINAAEGLMEIVDADLALKLGDYEKADSLLRQADLNLGNSIKQGGWEPEYLEFLQHSQEKTKEILAKIDVKPEVVLTMDQPKENLPLGRIVFTGRINNNSRNEINSLYFLPNLPQQFFILKELEGIEKLKAGETKDITLEASAKEAGTYKFAPLEILYKDVDGNKYMKASNDIRIVIT